ncbi:unnamed protein product [Peniophora sp. CBMAI 1063]|nr:unnamed protein product [Peniophora sp. CBMAI 1063]
MISPAAKTQFCHQSLSFDILMGVAIFKPGSVVRIVLHNFVTYAHATFLPGPYLNLVIGPNGTGKSTIAAALALGLNCPAHILKRSDNLPDYVQTGQKSGYVEIELKGLQHAANVIIRRTLFAGKKSSSFQLNGEPASGQEVIREIGKLNVNVSNMCNFLPQDRVAEFAQRSPQGLLQDTQRAAGDKSLETWHEGLIDKQKDRKEIERAIKTMSDEVQRLVNRNNSDKHLVQRMEERTRKVDSITTSKLLLLRMEIVNMKGRSDMIRQEMKGLELKVRRLKEKHQQMRTCRNHLQQDQGRLLSQMTPLKASVRNLEQELAAMKRRHDDLDGEARDISLEIENLKPEEGARDRKMTALNQSIADIRTSLQTPLTDSANLDSTYREMTKLEARYQSLHDLHDKVMDKQVLQVDVLGRLRNAVESAKTAVQQLSNRAQQRLLNLRASEPELVDVLLWLREHQCLFKKKIVEPPIVSLSVTHSKYRDAIEACFSYGQLRTFVAQTEEDYDLLNRLVVDTGEAIGRKCRINVTAFTAQRSDDGPLPASTAEPISVTQLQSTARERLAELMAGRKSGNYITGRTKNHVTRSKYGQQLPQVTTSMIKSARFLTVHDSTEESSAFENAHAVLRRNEEDLSKAEIEEVSMRREAESLSSQERECKLRIGDLKRLVDGDAERRRHRTALQQRLEAQEKELDALRSKPAVKDRWLSLRAQQDILRTKNIELAGQVGTLVRQRIAELRQLTDIHLRESSISSSLAALDALIEKHAIAEDDAVKAKQSLEDQNQTLKSDFQRVKDEFKELAQSSPQAFDAVKSSNERSEEDVREALLRDEQELEILVEVDPLAVEKFNQRQSKIESLTRELEEKSAQLEKIVHDVQTLHNLWVPRIKCLVESINEKFSHFFDRLCCAGAVELVEHEDYKEWAISILVKFRDDTQLEQLSAYRQSGGERSLTTMVYLLSLTAHLNGPFSLVDEINQGMDQRAERSLHNLLVETTCSDISGQYFLITPKLLPDLRYDPRMTIHCINNGDWLPDEEQHRVYLSDLNQLLESLESKGGYVA